MATFYALHLSRHVKGMAKGPVPAESAVFAGDWRDAENDIVRPAIDAMRACVPACYRKAFDRNQGLMWHGGRGAPYMTLRDRRGRYINTLYAIPYNK